MERKMFYGVWPMIFQRAKELRARLTASEIKLWDYVRTKPLEYKFRRQHPLKFYVADFYCHAAKLVIEADGSIHDLQEIKAKNEETKSHRIAKYPCNAFPE